MARKSIERCQPAQMPIAVVAAEKHPIDQHSSSHTIAIDSDTTMAYSLVDEGYQTNHETKKCGKF